MKTIIVYLATAALLFGCHSNTKKTTTESNSTVILQPEITTPDSIETTADFGIPTEEFSGIVNGEEITFAHKNYIRYKLTQNGKTSIGDLNTERGFGPDNDATVFVLDFEKPEPEQKYFVRYTGGRFTMLDANRKEIAGAKLTKK